MCNEEQAFLAAIAASPKDDAPRFPYADWLMERGRDAEAQEQLRRTTAEYHRAEDYFERLSSEHSEGYDEWNPIPIKTFIDVGHEWLATEKQDQWGRDYYYTQQGSESLRSEMGSQQMEEFWKNWELYTGLPGPGEDERHEPFFSCSC